MMKIVFSEDYSRGQVQNRGEVVDRLVREILQ